VSEFRIDPVRLLEGEYVSWVELAVGTKDAGKLPAAWVRKLGRHLFEVTINKELLERVDFAERGIVEYALKLHEVAHIRYGTYFGRLYGTQLYKWLYNLVEDVRIEHLLQGEFPTMVKPFRALYSAMQEKLYASERDENAQAVIQDCNVLYKALRYGKVDDDHDVTQFVLPRLEVAKRSSTDSVRVLATQTFAFVLSKHQLPVQVRIGARIKVVGSGERTEDEEKDMREAERVHRENGRGATPGSAGGEGEDGTVDVSVDSRDPRWDDVMIRHHHDAVSLAEGLKRMLGRIAVQPTYEGDIMLSAVAQQQAYMDSYTQEMHRTSTRFTRTSPKVDVILLVDQSGSMSGIQHQVSDMTIVVAAAIDMVRGCRLGVAGFGGPTNNTRFIKYFAGPAWTGDYGPVAGGGTPMGDCMVDVASSQMYEWRTDARRMMIVVTDGGPDSWEKVHAALQMPRYDKVIIVPLMIGAHYSESAQYESTFGRKVRFVVDASEMARAVVIALGEEAKL
jgi:uncharacterized protein (DUF305 family)